MGFKKKSKANLVTATTSRPKVLPQEEPPEPQARSPNWDSALVEGLESQKNTAESTPLSGDERHVTTRSPEVVSAETSNPPTKWKGKARTTSPEQYRPRETFLSPKQAKRAMLEGEGYILPTTEEDVPLGRRSSPNRAKTSEEWTTTDDSNDLYGGHKLRKSVFDNTFWQMQDHHAVKSPNPTQSAMQALHPP